MQENAETKKLGKRIIMPEQLEYVQVKTKQLLLSNFYYHLFLN